MMRRDYGCGRVRSSAATGRRPFFYPGDWSGDVVAQSPSQYSGSDDVTWRPSKGRDLLFAFVGQNTSCVRALLLRTWGAAAIPPTYDVGERPQTINIAIVNQMLIVP